MTNGDGGHDRSADSQKMMIDDALHQFEAVDQRPLTELLGSAAAAFTGPPPDSFTGYTILKEAHRGGQGLVYHAIQESTQRKVAIKVMREGPFAGQSDKARFDREVQILSRLNHPNIVTIHDTGVAAGFHYFVMDFISGQPLDVHMAGRQHTIDETLRLFAKICQAVNAAHLRGIIHRDLKPSNIRVDETGQPHVLDFGLAKTLGSIGVPPASTGAPSLPGVGDGSAGAPSLPGVGDGSVSGQPSDLPAPPKTITGQFVGSLPWAAPEQAAGRVHEIDLRTDVYSLGVVLYQMLTARFPYDTAGPMHDVIDRIINADPLRPRVIRRTINNEVETITLKCLAKDPVRRYQSAGELAKDIDRYLTGEPIEAKRDSLSYVLSKHLRRHKLPVSLVATAILAVAAGFISSTILWRQAVHQSEIAHAAQLAETLQRARAEANFQKARDAVDQMLSEVGHTDLANVPGMAPIRRALLERALKFYQGFLEQEGDDPVVRFETAAAHVRVAGIHEMLLQRSEQRIHQEQALSAFESLAADIADRPDHRVRFATVLTNVADLLRDTGAVDAAEKKYRQAIALWEELTADTPSAADYQKFLAMTYYGLGQLLASAGRISESVQTNRQALQLFAALAADSPVEPLYALRVAECNGEIGICLAQLGQARQAVAPFQQAVEMFESLVERYPDSSRYRERVGLGHINLAILLSTMGRAEEAETADRKAIDAYEQLASDFPARPEYRRMLAESLSTLGVLLWQSQRLDDAEQMFRRVLSMHEQFIEQHPAQAIFPSLAGGSAHNLAMVLGDQDADLREVSSLFEQAIAHQKAALRIAPRNTMSREYLRNHYDSLFDTLEQLGEFEQAEQAVRRGLVIARKLAADFPETVRYRNLVALSLYNLGNRLQKSQRFDEAVPPYSEALQICIQLTRDEPDVPQYRKDVANTYRQLGITHFRTDDWPAAADALEKAVELRGDDIGATERFYLAMTRWQLGDKDRARELYDRAVKWTQENEPETEEPHQLRAEAAQLLGIKK